MKKVKKTNKRYPLFSNKRYVSDPEAITNFFGDTKIILEMKANKEHWELLWDYFQTNGLKKVGEDFVNSFLGPIQAKMHGKTDYKEGKAAFIDNMRMLSGILYEVFFYCLQKYKNNLPVYIRKITDDKLLQEIKPNKKPDAAILYTAYFVQTIYGDLLDKFRIKPFFAYDEETINQDLESFRITYVQVGKNFIKYNYDDVIAFFCYTCIIGGFLFDCKVFRENEHIRNFYTVLHKAFFYRKNKNREIGQEVIELHNILLEIFPWLTDIKNILTRLRWENPYINDDGFVKGLPSDEAIDEYRRTHNLPPEKLSFYNPKK